MTEPVEVTGEASSTGMELSTAASGAAFAWALATLGAATGSMWVGPAIPDSQSDPTQPTVQEIFVVTESDVITALAALSAHLEASIQPIEPEVRDVLYSNLWDLYEA